MHAIDTDPAARLAALVPTIDPDGYARRDLDGIEDVAMLDVARDKGFNVLLEGPTGTGKTLVAEVYAAIHHLPMVVNPVNASSDPSVWWGQMSQDPATGRFVWVPSNLALAWQAEGGAVIVWDEFDMGSPRTMAASNDPLSDARRVTVMENFGASLTAAPGVLNVATMNGRGYAGTGALNVATRRRFKWSYTFGYDRAVEEQLIESATLLDIAFSLRDRDRFPDIRTDLATPTLEMVEETAGVFGATFALERLVHSFDPTERADVRRAVEMLAPTIASELGVSL